MRGQVLRFWLIPRSYSLYYIDGRRVSLVIASVQRSGSSGLKFRPVFGPNLAHWDPAFLGGFWWTPQAILGATEVQTGAALWCHDWTRYGKDMSRCHMTWQDMAWFYMSETRHDIVWLLMSHAVTGPRDPASSQVSKYKISRYSLSSVKKIGWDSVACWDLVVPNVGPQGS